MLLYNEVIPRASIILWGLNSFLSLVNLTLVHLNSTSPTALIHRFNGPVTFQQDAKSHHVITSATHTKAGRIHNIKRRMFMTKAVIGCYIVDYLFESIETVIYQEGILHLGNSYCGFIAEQLWSPRHFCL